MNKLKPYNGNEKYIFISYSHRDTDMVYPIISRLMANGYRVWYDGGIDPGTEWDENIAGHIEKCGYFLAFLSNNYLNSNNCKDELNYARDLEKDRLIVYLEDVTLPSGLAMRINRLQSIFKYAYASEKDFYEKLFTANNIECCLDESASTGGSSYINESYSDDNTTSGNTYTQSSQFTYNHSNAQTASKPVETAKKSKNKGVAGLLAIFLGYFGAHWFYLGKPLRAVIYIVACSLIPFLYLAYLAEGIYFLVTTEEKFQKYISWNPKKK